MKAADSSERMANTSNNIRRINLEDEQLNLKMTWFVTV
jgi:hypothetical protein